MHIYEAKYRLYSLSYHKLESTQTFLPCLLFPEVGFVYPNAFALTEKNTQANFFFSMESVLDDIIDKSGILDNINGISNERSISAFVSWSQEFVEISYPRAGDAWVKRSDCGSHSQHRWGLYDNEL